MNFSIRPMLDSDIEAVLAIERVSYPFPWSEQGFIVLLNEGFALVLEDADLNVVGYACCRAIIDEVDVLNICIAEHLRGQGVGAWFLERVQIRLAEAKYNRALLEVRVENEPARKLYQKLGWVEDGIRKGYYRNKDGTQTDAVLMSLDLSSTQN